MKEKSLIAGNVALFLALNILLAGLQTALWLQIFGNIPAPKLWLPALIYLILYRPQLEGILVVYLHAIVLSFFTVMPFGLLMLICLLLFAALHFVRERFFWPGSGYFALVCGCAAMVFHVFHIILSWITENNPVTHPAVSNWLLSTVLTPFAAVPLFYFFTQIDRWTKRDPLAESVELN